MDVYTHLPQVVRFIGEPWFSVILMLAGFGLLWRFARQSESVKTSQLIHPYTRQPIVNPIYPAFRRSILAALVAVVPALSIWSFYKTPIRDFLVIQPLRVALNIPSVTVEPAAPTNQPAKTLVTPIPPSPPVSSPNQDLPNSNPKDDATHPVANPLPPPGNGQQEQTSQSQPHEKDHSRPSDYEKLKERVISVDASRAMQNVLANHDTITFLITWMDDDTNYLPYLSQMFNSACRTTPKQCWFAQPSGPFDLAIMSCPKRVRLESLFMVHWRVRLSRS